jgi:hypothetical protein
VDDGELRPTTVPTLGCPWKAAGLFGWVLVSEVYVHSLIFYFIVSFFDRRRR